MARFWLSRHDMFRELATMIKAIETQFRAGTLRAAETPAPNWVRGFASCCSGFGVHHQIEDLHYFPIFQAAADAQAGARLRRAGRRSPRHPRRHGCDGADAANALLRALAGEADALRRCGDDYAAASGALLKGLIRHLDDEEDLIVPLILDPGEAALGVARRGCRWARSPSVQVVAVVKRTALAEFLLIPLGGTSRSVLLSAFHSFAS